MILTPTLAPCSRPQEQIGRFFAWCARGANDEKGTALCSGERTRHFDFPGARDRHYANEEACYRGTKDR
ncbi:hypothetical protein BaRGS_00008209 [Batillaria attramentaria]|uniref:Uncharacterized protein n=1 Tax=Batillaria attramentaria TaxID=370345 RepID=A0ABD0LNP2_9CAEN